MVGKLLFLLPASPFLVNADVNGLADVGPFLPLVNEQVDGNGSLVQTSLKRLNDCLVLGLLLLKKADVNGPLVVDDEELPLSVYVASTKLS